jgi:hypothetical protein
MEIVFFKILFPQVFDKRRIRLTLIQAVAFPLLLSDFRWIFSRRRRFHAYLWQTISSAGRVL